MTLVIEESEDISPDLLAPILATLKKNNQVNLLGILYKLFNSMYYKVLTEIHFTLTGCYTKSKEIG